MSYITQAGAVSQGGSFVTEEDKFLRLELERPGEIPDEYEYTLSRGQLVDIFANIFGRGACGSADDPGAYAGPESGETALDAVARYLKDKYQGIAGAQELATAFGLGNICLPSRLEGEVIKKTVYLHAYPKSVFSEYDLVSPDAADKEGPSVVYSDVYIKLEFSNTSYIPIYYFIDIERLSKYLKRHHENPVYEWRGVVKDSQNQDVRYPSWNVAGNRVYFPGVWSGVLVIKKLPIMYHTWQLTLDGVLDAAATWHYSATVFGKAPNISIVQLDVAEDIAAEDVQEECPWLEYGIEMPPGGGVIIGDCKNCDDGGGGGGASPGDDEDDGGEKAEDVNECNGKITPEEYSEECCGGPLIGCLPPCREVVAPFNGPARSKQEDDGYRGNTSTIVLMPVGEPCGTITKTYETSGSCDDCEGIVELAWSDQNPTVVSPGGSVDLIVTGGNASIKPITWKITGGTGYTFDGGVTEVVNGNGVTVHASADVCGSTTVTADDGCTNASGGLDYAGGIYITNGVMALYPGNNLIAFTASGIKPYAWSIEGPCTITQYGTENDSYARVKMNADACEDCQVTVGDPCGDDTRTITNTKNDIYITNSAMSRFPGTNLIVYTASGMKPYAWGIEGPCTITQYGTVNDAYARVMMNEDACEDCQVTVSDPCSDDTKTITNTKQDILITNIDPYLSPGSSVIIYTQNGKSPYDWSVEGECSIIAYGGTGDAYATVRLNANACGDCTVNVSDTCSGDSVVIDNTRTPVDVTGPSSLAEGENGVASCTGGIAPFVWTSTGDIVITSSPSSTSRTVDIRNDGEGGSVKCNDDCTEDTISISKAL